MNKISVLGFFLLVGILVGFNIREPLIGTVTGAVIGIAAYFFIPEKKKGTAKKASKA
jgi:uncharacterized membrane protein (UPF0136 family)